MFGNNEKKALKVLLKFLFYRILLKLFDFLKKKSTNKQKIKFKIKITIAASVAGPIKKISYIISLRVLCIFLVNQ